MQKGRELYVLPKIYSHWCVAYFTTGRRRVGLGLNTFMLYSRFSATEPPKVVNEIMDVGVRCSLEHVARIYASMFVFWND